MYEWKEVPPEEVRARARKGESVYQSALEATSQGGVVETDGLRVQVRIGSYTAELQVSPQDRARIRLRTALDLLDAHVASIRSHVEAGIPHAAERQGLVSAAVSVSELIAVIAALEA